MQIISPLELYLILQLDSIGFLFTLLAVFLGFGLAISLFLAAISEEEIMEYKKAVKVVPYFLIMSLISAFLPSTKTMAAMVIVPKIANSEVAQQEAGELYYLAKQALKDAVTTEETTEEQE